MSNVVTLPGLLYLRMRAKRMPINADKRILTNLYHAGLIANAYGDISAKGIQALQIGNAQNDQAALRWINGRVR